MSLISPSTGTDLQNTDRHERNDTQNRLLTNTTRKIYILLKIGVFNVFSGKYKLKNINFLLYNKTRLKALLGIIKMLHVHLPYKGQLLFCTMQIQKIHYSFFVTSMIYTQS